MKKTIYGILFCCLTNIITKPRIKKNKKKIILRKKIKNRHGNWNHSTPVIIPPNQSTISNNQILNFIDYNTFIATTKNKIENPTINISELEEIETKIKRTLTQIENQLENTIKNIAIMDNNKTQLENTKEECNKLLDSIKLEINDITKHEDNEENEEDQENEE